MKKIRVILSSAVLIFALAIAGCGKAADKTDDIEGKTARQEQDAESPAGQQTEIRTGQSEGMRMQNRIEDSALPLSEYYVKVSADGKEAVFRLYDTAAAEKLYEQLPLTLETENFRDAQWMFYPPEKLPVTADEAYHDGMKGELSYYEPWGDVFILYEDFYAGDEMHRLGICTSGTEVLESFDERVTVERLEQSEGENGMMTQTIS